MCKNHSTSQIRLDLEKLRQVRKLGGLIEIT